MVKHIFFSVLLFCSSLIAQVTFVTSNSTTGASVGTVTLSNYTVASGNNRLLVVGIATTNDGQTGAITVSSVTFNSVSMTQVCNADVTDDNQVWIYQLIAPDVTTANVVVTFSHTTAEWISVGAANFTGVDQTTPCGTCASDVNDDATYSISVSSATNDIVVDVFAAENATSATVGASQTANWNNAIGTSGGAGSSSREVGASSVTMSWTAAGSPSHAVLTGVSLKAAPIVSRRKTIF